MTDRIRLDDLTSDQYDALCERLEAAEGTESQRQLAVAREALASATVRAARAEEISRSQLDLIERIARRARRAEAAIARVRALADEWDLHAPPPGNRPLTELRAALDGPEHADTTQPEPSSWLLAGTRDLSTPVTPAEHCGHLSPQTLLTTPRTECVLRPGHQGSHADDRGCRWWYDATLGPLVDRPFRTHRQHATDQPKEN